MKTLVIKGITLYYEKVVDGEDTSNYTYELYDSNKEMIESKTNCASAIINFKGVRAIAKAYTTYGADSNELDEELKQWCF